MINALVREAARAAAGGVQGMFVSELRCKKLYHTRAARRIFVLVLLHASPRR